MAMGLRYFYDLMSQPSRAVYIFLKVNNIPFEAKPVALRKGEHYSDEYKKINPFSLVPVIDDNGFVLTESVAILKYLVTKYNLPEHWYPRTNLQDQARVEEYLNWQHANTRIKSARLFAHLLILPKAQNKPVDWDSVEFYRSEVKETIGYLENVWLKDKPYLCGNDISIGDILGICELMQLYGVYEDNFYESSPVVKAWMERVKERLQPYFDEAHKMIYRTREMYPQIEKQLAKL